MPRRYAAEPHRRFFSVFVGCLKRERQNETLEDAKKNEDFVELVIIENGKKDFGFVWENFLFLSYIKSTVCFFSKSRGLTCCLNKHFNN